MRHWWLLLIIFFWKAKDFDSSVFCMFPKGRILVDTLIAGAFELSVSSRYVLDLIWQSKG